MVSLAICVDSPPDGGPEHETNLRNSALWHPDVPGPALQLNEESFFPLRARFVSELSYKPLFWCHFGGPGGKYLPHLTRVSATSGDGTRRIRFFFDLKVPTEHRALGRLADLRVREGQNVEFPVDGPGGERIVAVEMGHQFCEEGKGLRWKTEQGVMVWFKFYTNRGRSCLISSPEFGEVTDCRTVMALPGTAITGLYASQRPEGGYGMAALGVVSEVTS